MNWQHIWIDPQTGRIRSGWRVLIFLLIASMASAIIISVLELSLQNAIKDKFMKTYVAHLCEAAALIPAFLGASIWALNTLDRLPARTLGLSFDGKWLKSLGVGMGIGTVLMTGALLLLRVFGLATIFWQQPNPHQCLLLLLTLAGLLLFAVQDALIFHGYAFQTLLRGIGVLPALLFIAVLYAVLHVSAPASGPLTPPTSMIALLNMFMCGLLFGLLYLRFGSLWLPIGVLTGWNFVQNVFQVDFSGLQLPVLGLFPTHFLQQPLLTGGGYGPEGGLMVSALLLGSIAVVTRMRQGEPLSSTWWEWRNLLVTSHPPTPWDFSVNSRYYQWKLLSHEQTNGE